MPEVKPGSNLDATCLPEPDPHTPGEPQHNQVCAASVQCARSQAKGSACVILFKSSTRSRERKQACMSEMIYPRSPSKELEEMRFQHRSVHPTPTTALAEWDPGQRDTEAFVLSTSSLVHHPEQTGSRPGPQRNGLASCSRHGDKKYLFDRGSNAPPRTRGGPEAWPAWCPDKASCQAAGGFPSSASPALLLSY